MVNTFYLSFGRGDDLDTIVRYGTLGGAIEFAESLLDTGHYEFVDISEGTVSNCVLTIYEGGQSYPSH